MPASASDIFREYTEPLTPARKMLHFRELKEQYGNVMLEFTMLVLISWSWVFSLE
jgi:hypothetical protein